MIGHPSGRPIRRPEVKKLSIIRNPGTGALLERLRPTGRLEEVGLHQWARRPGESPEEQCERLLRAGYPFGG
jgi:hypothetical protein